MNRVSKRTSILIISFILILTFVSSRGASAEVFQIGVFSFSLPANSSWQLTGEHEINHWTVLTHKGKPTVIMINFEAVSTYQNGGKAEDGLLFSHQQWADYLLLHGKQIQEHKRFMRGKDELWVEMKIIQDNKIFHTARIYRLFKEASLIVIGTLEAPDSNSQFKGEFNDLMETVRIHEDFLSPCVRTAMMAKQFLRFIEIEKRSGNFEKIRAYKDSLGTELKNSLKEHEHHAWAVYYLLGYLESINARGELLGVGFHFEQARDNFEKAHAANPCALEPLEALRSL